MDGKPSVRLQTISPHLLSKVPFIDISPVNSPRGLPDLTHSGPISPPDSDLLSVVYGSGPDEAVQLHDGVEWAGDSPEATSDHDSYLILSDDALFSESVRFPSPSCSSVVDTGNGGSTLSLSTSPQDICLSTQENPLLADATDHCALEPRNAPSKAKKPRIILRLPQPKTQVLRLNQPKPVVR